MNSAARRFPWGLTVWALIGFAILVSLGVWQVYRLGWKEALLAKVAALETAPARPIAEVLTQKGSVEFERVEATCTPVAAPAGRPSLYRYAVRDDRVGWRLLSPCRVAAGPYDGIVLDRGIIERFMGSTSPQPASFPPAGAVVGVLRAAGPKPWLGPAVMEQGPGLIAYRVIDHASLAQIGRAEGLSRPAPYMLAVEQEAPPLAGVTPAAIPKDIPNNHLVYALTWFSLALILAWFYGSMLISWRRS
ncbi:MAG TPA: SURF1 family cytochrome oxidase biogenesis protein [Caulobacteraceae bacterium]|jgi:surfeit locus 1 family protein